MTITYADVSGRTIAKYSRQMQAFIREVRMSDLGATSLDLGTMTLVLVPQTITLQFEPFPAVGAGGGMTLDVGQFRAH